MFEWCNQGATRKTSHWCRKGSKNLHLRRNCSRLPSYSSLSIYRKSLWYSPLKMQSASKNKMFPSSFSHDLSRYCVNHIVKQLIMLQDDKLSAISRTDEVYISLSLQIKVSQYTRKDRRVVLFYSEFNFLDSFQSCPEVWTVWQRQWRLQNFSTCEEKSLFLKDVRLQKVRGKCHFPHRFLDSFEKFGGPFPD